jgi:hypothetical protein
MVFVVEDKAPTRALRSCLGDGALTDVFVVEEAPTSAFESGFADVDGVRRRRQGAHVGASGAGVADGDLIDMFAGRGKAPTWALRSIALRCHVSFAAPSVTIKVVVV